MEKSNSFSSVLKNRGFLNLWVNQILVQLSYNSLNFALIIWVFRLTDSNVAVSALLFTVYLPAVLFGLFAGILVDITDRRRIINLINFLLSLSFLGLIFAKQSYALILLLAFIINTLAQFYVPAESSAIPLIVKRKQLMTANSLFSITLFASFLVGFGLAGPLISHFGIDFVFGSGAAALGLAFLLSFTFSSITSKPGIQGTKLIKALRKKNFQAIGEVVLIEIRQTLKLIKRRLSVLSAILILAGVQVVVAIMAVLIPSFMERVVQINATDASYILILPLGLGMILGGIFIGKRGYRFPKRIIVGRAIMIAGLLLFAVGIAPLISPVIKYFPKPRPLPFFYQPPLSTILFAGSFLLGIAMVSIVIPSQTVLQENTPAGARGKVFAVMGTVMAGMSLLPVLFAGALADIFGTLPIFIAAGGVIGLIGLFVLKPDFYFTKEHLSLRLREFLGLGHWKK